MAHDVKPSQLAVFGRNLFYLVLSRHSLCLYIVHVKQWVGFLRARACLNIVSCGATTKALILLLQHFFLNVSEHSSAFSLPLACFVTLVLLLIVCFSTFVLIYVQLGGADTRTCAAEI